MKNYKSADIRNLAVVGHGSSGKTMLCEAMLLCSGAINRLGSILQGSTVSDYHLDEQAHKISIHSCLMHAEWLDKKLNIIDTPGYLDFISESLGALRVADFALVVIHASNGVEVGTEQVWDFATRFSIPKIIVVNGLDNENTNFDKILAQLRERFGRTVFPMNFPMNPGPGFNQLADVMRSDLITYSAGAKGRYEESALPEELEPKVKQLHRDLIEYVAESDESLLEKFFDQDGLSEEEMREGLRTALLNQSFIPLFCTSADSNVGVARLMDFIAKFAPSPVDREKVQASDPNGSEVEVALSDPKPALLIFKTLSEAHVGDMSFFRLYSGSINTGMDLLNSSRKSTERIGQIFILNGKNRTNVNTLYAGDIGAVVKLKNTHVGNTLCAPSKVVVLPPVEYPMPNIHGALKLKAKGDEGKIAEGLATLHEEDPAFLYRADPEIKQTVISGQGEMHLQIIIETLKRRFNVSIDLVEPRIPFRETIKAKAGSKYRHKKQSGGAGQFAEVWMRIEPKERDSGIEFTQSLSGQNVDRVFVPSVEKGVNAACREGIIAGCHVVDIKVEFYDGKMHPVDSKDVAFQIAGKHAFREAFQQAKPCLLEPIYNIRVKIPKDAMGDIMGDISSRRGRIAGIEAEGSFQVVNAHVPQMELYRYSTVIRSLTGGRGLHSEEFSHYEEMPRDLEQKIISRSKEEKE